MNQTTKPKHLVLYADDDEDDRLYLTESFYSCTKNSELVCFENGLALLDFLKDRSSDEQKPCLIILDINMPAFSGKETLKEIRKMGSLSNVPVVLFTTSSSPEDLEFAKRNDAGFITKPLDLSQMEKIVHTFVEYCVQKTTPVLQ